MNTYYVYDASMDHDEEDPGYMGSVEAMSQAEAEAEARKVWPSIPSLRVVA